MTAELRNIAKKVKGSLERKEGEFLDLANKELDKIESCRLQRRMLLNLIAFLLPTI